MIRFSWDDLSWETIDAKAAFFEHFDTDISIHDSSIRLDFECFGISWLERFHDVVN